MAKPKNPLMSFSSHGSVGGSLTYQSRLGGTMVRKKPIPTDPKTLLQTYHRWLYQDYAALWRTLTPAQQAVWTANARRRKITGFNLWMSVKLATLPDIIGMWHLDEKAGIIALDHGKLENDGDIFGALHTKGLIDYGLYFDGIDDRVDFGTDPSLQMEDEDFSFLCYLYPLSYLHPWRVFIGAETGGAAFGLKFAVGRLMLTKAYVADAPSSLASPPLNTWSHVAITFDSHKATNNLIYYINGDEVKTVTFDVDFTAGATTRHLGCLQPGDHHFDGSIDEFRIYNRILSAEDIKRHSERRYPE